MPWGKSSVAAQPPSTKSITYGAKFPSLPAAWHNSSDPTFQMEVHCMLTSLAWETQKTSHSEVVYKAARFVQNSSGNGSATLLHAVHWCLVLTGNDSQSEWCRFAHWVLHYSTIFILQIMQTSHAVMCFSMVTWKKWQTTQVSPKIKWLQTAMSHIFFALLIFLWIKKNLRKCLQSYETLFQRLLIFAHEHICKQPSVIPKNALPFCKHEIARYH